MFQGVYDCSKHEANCYTRQAMHRITERLGAFLQPILQWKIHKHYTFWESICSLRYLTCKAHALFRNIWPVWIYQIFRRLRKIANSDYSASSYVFPSVHPHGTIRLSLDGFSRNLVFEYFSKTCRQISSFILKMTRITGSLYEDQYEFSIISRSINLRMKNISEKSCR